MNNYVFYEVILNNVNLFIFLLLFSSVLHSVIFKNLLYGWLDPFLLPIIANIFCFVVVYILYLTGNTSFYTFLSYNLTQLSFFCGLFVFKKRIKFNFSRPVDSISYSLDRSTYNIFAFYFFSIIYLGCQITIYVFKGIPLLMESRLSTFADGGGAGILGRITDVSSIFALYSFFCVIKIDKFRLREIPKFLILLLIFVTYFLSGGKSNFLAIFYVFWCFVFFSAVKKVDYSAYKRFITTHLKKGIVFALFFVLAIISVQSRDIEDQLNPLLLLVLRFVHSGDIYWYAYPNNVYLQIDSSNGFKSLFNDGLGLLRVYPWEELPTAIGIVFKDIHHPSDVPSGPNARHNVFGLIYYGFYGSILFSFVLGLVISFIRNLLPFLLRNNLLNGFIFAYLFLKMTALDSDPMLTLTYVNNLLFIFPILFLTFLLLFEASKFKFQNNA